MIHYTENRIVSSVDTNKTNIEYINIKRLFGRYDVNVKFDKNVNIMVGENGLGKTTILNSIYYVLVKKFSRLANIDFSQMEIKFKNSSPMEFSKNDVVAYINHDGTKRYKSWMEIDIINELKKILLYKNGQRVMDNLIGDLDYIAYRISKKYDIPSRVVEKYIISYITSNKSGEVSNTSQGKKANIEKLNKVISANVKNKILYLPTYRRIEDDYTELNLMIKEKKDSDLLIQFGMSDVQKSIDSTLDTIRTIAAQNFTNMSGVLLKQYLDNRGKLNNNMIDERIDTETATIILDRIGDKIDTEDKKKILEIIDENDYRENSYLLNLIMELKKNYDSQKIYDEKINKFVSACNNYMIDKHIEYIPSKLSLNICMNSRKRKKNEIELMSLSSGEKQIVSLFSKLYLENNNNCIMIIDEPELSLSIDWQRKILPDIMKSGNCDLLLAVTHSPFVFDNEFDMWTHSMRDLIAPVID